MKKKFAKGFLWFCVGFVVFFGLRLLYGYMAYPDGKTMYEYEDTGFNFSVRNFASYKKLRPSAGSDGGKDLPVAVPDAMKVSESMKYEKVGVVRSRTAGFSRDEGRTRKLIAQHNVLIQSEQSSGLQGRRILHLGLGVVPEKFDEVVSQLRKIGRLQSIRVDKTDKTNEYRELGARRISLEKTRDALLGLKGRGSVEEAIALENRIFDIEQELQSLGVRLGEFDTENEFCTVKFSLYEGSVLAIPFSSRLKRAFEWTVKFYLAFLTVLVLGALLILIVLAILEKLRWIPSSTKKIWNAQDPSQP